MDSVQRRLAVLSNHVHPAGAEATSADIQLDFADVSASTAPLDLKALRIFLDGHNLELRDELQRLLVEDPLFQVSPKFHNAQKEVQRQITDLRYGLVRIANHAWLASRDYSSWGTCNMLQATSRNGLQSLKR